MENIWRKFHLVYWDAELLNWGVQQILLISIHQIWKKKCFNNFFRKALPKLIRLDIFRVFWRYRYIIPILIANMYKYTIIVCKRLSVYDLRWKINGQQLQRSFYYSFKFNLRLLFVVLNICFVLIKIFEN